MQGTARKFCVFNAQVFFSVGFALACVYHLCHAHPDGLAATAFLGVSGAHWRTFDVLCCQWLLGRTIGHALGAEHPVLFGKFPVLVAHR